MQTRGAVRRLHPTILVVDDDEDLLIMVERYLKREGFGVLTCKTIPMALQLLDEWSISVVVTDLYLEDAEGTTLLEAVHRWHRGVSAIIMTGDHTACLKYRALGVPCVVKGEAEAMSKLVSVIRGRIGA